MRKILDGLLVDMTAQEEAAFEATRGPAAAVVPMTISRRQFFKQAARMGLVTATEAKNALSRSSMPNKLSSFISSLVAGQRDEAEMDLIGADTLTRGSPPANALLAALGVTDQAVADTLWIEGAKL